MKTIVKSFAVCSVAVLLGMPAWAMPIPDASRVTVNGATWAQAQLFIDVHWDEVDTQCPAGICTSGSTLKGFDMSGWTWAGPEEVAALFNFYLANDGVTGNDLLDPANLQDSYTEFTSGYAPWVTAFTTDFDPLFLEHDGTAGVFGYVAGFTSQRYSMLSRNQLDDQNTYENIAAARFIGSYETGAWFFCTDECPSSQSVPLPSALPLVAIALAALCISRRKLKQLS